MIYADAKTTEIDVIPVIDIAPLYDGGTPESEQRVAQEIIAASEHIGFFYIKNHRIPDLLTQRLFQASKDFFFSAPEIKQSVAVTEKQRGYIEPMTGVMEGGKLPDLRETFLWGREFPASVLEELSDVPLIGANQWPVEVSTMRPVFSEYLENCIAVGRRILDAIATGLGVEKGLFTRSFTRTISRGSSLFYPPQSEDLGPEQFGIGDHVDWGVLTLLNQDAVGGLQVCSRENQWITAPPIPGTLIVNVGNCLERWTNKRLLSNRHRVVNSQGVERQSVAVFVDPDFDTPLNPILAKGESRKFEPTTCGQQVMESFAAAYKR